MTTENKLECYPSFFFWSLYDFPRKRLQRSELNSKGGLSIGRAQGRWGSLISHQQQIDCSNFHMQDDSFKWMHVTTSEIYWHGNLNLWRGGSKCVYMYLYICMCLCIHVYTHVYVCLYVCIYTYKHIYGNIHAYIHTHTATEAPFENVKEA